MSQDKPSRMFIVNCIIRILRAPCSPANEEERASDLSEAIRIASEADLGEAHKYLINLCDKAEAGKYSGSPAPEESL